MLNSAAALSFFLLNSSVIAVHVLTAYTQHTEHTLFASPHLITNPQLSGGTRGDCSSIKDCLAKKQKLKPAFCVTGSTG